MKLKDLVDESLVEPDGRNTDREDDFEKEFNKGYLELIKDKIRPRSIKLYHFTNRFYLTTYTDEYIGHIEFEEENISGKKCLFITESFSKKVYKIGGFYKLMIGLILTYTSFNYVFNDERTSKSAMKSWKRLINYPYIMQPVSYDTRSKKIEKYDTDKVDEYWTSISGDWKKYRVGLTLETLNEYTQTYFSDAQKECDKIFETYEKIRKWSTYTEQNMRMMEHKYYGIFDEDYIAPFDKTEVHDYLREIYNHGN